MVKENVAIRNSLKMVTWDMEGIWSHPKRKLIKWLQGGMDVFMLQNVQARDQDLDEDLARPKGLLSWFHPNNTDYSGTAIYCRPEAQPIHVHTTTGITLLDRGGRVMVAEYMDMYALNVDYPRDTTMNEFCQRLTQYVDKLELTSSKAIVFYGEVRMDDYLHLTLCSKDMLPRMLGRGELDNGLKTEHHICWNEWAY